MSFTWTLTNAFIAAGVGAPLDTELIEEIQDNIDLLGGVAAGTSTFNSLTGRAITIADQGGVAYHVSITPTENPGGNLGEVWVVNNSATQFTVYNGGTATTAFSYKVLG